MNIRDFLFSNRWYIWLLRHLTFWLGWGTYFALVRYFNPNIFLQTGKLGNPLEKLAESFLWLSPQTFLVYTLLYFVLPRYVFKAKYLKAFLFFLVLLMLSLLIHALVIIYIPEYRLAYKPLSHIFDVNNPISRRLPAAYMSAMQGGLTGAALAVSFKMFKHYYIKNQINQQLTQEKTEAQLQLLKAQIHPHFLFNTLNNIYSQAQEESPRSANMLMELSHILRYVLEEGRKDIVPLENEIQLLKDYIHLETIRYDDRLDLQVSLPEAHQSLGIAPLLLLPIVENSFKHGASRIIREPWIHIILKLDGSTLYMTISNGKKPGYISDQSRQGLGIANVKNRLELLYHERYTFEIEDETDRYIIRLRLELDDSPNSDGRLHQTESTKVYEHKN